MTTYTLDYPWDTNDYVHTAVIADGTYVGTVDAEHAERFVRAVRLLDRLHDGLLGSLLSCAMATGDADLRDIVQENRQAIRDVLDLDLGRLEDDD